MAGGGMDHRKVVVGTWLGVEPVVERNGVSTTPEIRGPLPRPPVPEWWDVELVRRVRGYADRFVEQDRHGRSTTDEDVMRS